MAARSSRYRDNLIILEFSYDYFHLIVYFCVKRYDCSCLVFFRWFFIDLSLEELFLQGKYDNLSPGI